MIAHDGLANRPPQHPLTPAALLRDFGARASVTRDGVRTLHDALLVAPPEALAHWRILFGKWAGRAADRVPRQLAKLASRYGISTNRHSERSEESSWPHINPSTPPRSFAALRMTAPPSHKTLQFACDGSDTLLFALQTYYALVVNLVANRVVGGHGNDLLPDSPFAWHHTAATDAVGRLANHLTETLAGYQLVPPASATDDDCDLFKPLYQDIFPRPLRHALGEYYTPDWLAGHVLDQVGYTGEPGQRLLDPACGSGTFLMMALRRLRGRAEGEKRKAEVADENGSFPIIGFDLNPLAVMTARANYLIAIADLLPTAGRMEAPVYLCDSILGVPSLPCAAEPFDYVVGNPPWIAWDNLPDDDRQATKPLWERYGLFSLSGNEARHGGGKKDLSMLMLYAAADRYLKPAGRLGMVITQTLFQTKGAGDGFRRFRLGPDGPPLGVLRVDDMVALRPFDDAANWTSTIVLQKGTATKYPVPYYRWENEGDEGREAGDGDRGLRVDEAASLAASPFPSPASHPPSPSVHHSSFIIHHSCARPIDPTRPHSPWLIFSERDGDSSSFLIPHSSLSADYSAHLGANSGGANGVYWVDLLGTEPDGVRIRNKVARGKRQVETVEQVIEPDLLYPLLRWSDVARYSAVPRGHILLAQDPATRTGIDEAVMCEQYPRTLNYLNRFRGLLLARAAYRRYQDRSPFYSMYNVGPYTIAPVKVVWRRMDRRINAAVVEETDDPLLGRRPMIPQETCVLVVCDSVDEAHYICAVLNSALVGDLVSASSVRGGKGFGTPGMLEYVPLRRYQPDNARHVELAALSRRAHIDYAEEIQRHIDLLAAKVLC